MAIFAFLVRIHRIYSQSIKSRWDQRAIIILLFSLGLFPCVYMPHTNCIVPNTKCSNCSCQGGVIKCGHINLHNARPTQFIVFHFIKNAFSSLTAFKRIHTLWNMEMIRSFSVFFFGCVHFVSLFQHNLFKWICEQFSLSKFPSHTRVSIFG